MIKKEDHKEEKSEDNDTSDESKNVLGLLNSMAAPQLRMLSLYGDLDEKKGAEITYSLFAYRDLKKFVPVDMENPKSDIIQITEPLQFLISTPGGSAADMFSIYDCMKIVEKDMDIHTIGIGKVMSAGVLLLAAGTKGKRSIGKNCRVMIHAVQAGTGGSSHDIKNEVDEIMQTQEQYIKCLAQETTMNVKQIRELIDEKRNIYLSAKEAKKYGIVDEIL